MLELDCIGQRILVVDDEPSIASVLEYVLTDSGYAVTRARDGVEALDRINELPPDLVLLDLEMPRMSGFEVCQAIKSTPSLRFLPVIILTGQEVSAARLHAWELGADDFLHKPFQTIDVVARCRSLLRLKQVVDELDSAETVVFALARTIEAKNSYTQGHSERVTTHALGLADRIGLSAKERNTLERGAALHDVGKIAIPDGVLNKPGSLSSEEYAIIKTHPIEGVRIVEPLRSTRDAIPLIRSHHERIDGKGYPDGLVGEAIPFLARLLAVADVYDALASARPYRSAMQHEQCLQILRQEAEGGGLDPELVRLFCQAPAVPLLSLRPAPSRSRGPEPRTDQASRDVVPHLPYQALHVKPTDGNVLPAAPSSKLE